MKVVFPIAGRGSRFLEQADKNPIYAQPKPLIPIKGEPMITWAAKSLPFLDMPFRRAETNLKVKPRDLIFIILSEHQKDHGIADKLREIFTEEINIVELPDMTRGALETAHKAKPYLVNDEDVIISDSDHFFDGEELYRVIATKDEETAGIIPVFETDPHPKWSYTLTDNNHVALAVGEKDMDLALRGAYANIGGYYFSSGRLFLEEAEEMIERGSMYGAEGKKEFYVAPMYHRMIMKGRKVKVAVIPKVWGLGTPEDAEYFDEYYEI